MTEAGEKPRFLDRRAIARAFDRASPGYDQAAGLQVAVRTELLERLAHFSAAPRVVLDAGAGTGHATRALKQIYPGALVLGLDLAPGMLVQAGQRMGLRDRVLGGRFGHRFERVAGDVYHLPLADGSVQLVFSSLMLQWCDDLETALVEIRRVLAPGGLLLFSSFGPQTLQELRAAWSAADGAEHVNPFMDMHEVGTAMARAGFTEPVLDVDRIVRHYADALQLMREIKQIGARNALHGRQRGLTGRKRLAAMQAAYEAERDPQGRLPATWEVIYAAGFAADRGGRSGGEEFVIPVSGIGRR